MISRFSIFNSFLLGLQIDEIFDEGVGDLKDKIPTLLVMNKKDLIKPGEIAKKLEVRISHHLHCNPFGDFHALAYLTR